MASGKGSAFSVGGMQTKLEAAKICEKAGTAMAIAHGEDPTVIHRILAGEDVGTCFGKESKGEMNNEQWIFQSRDAEK